MTATEARLRAVLSESADDITPPEQMANTWEALEITARHRATRRRRVERGALLVSLAGFASIATAVAVGSPDLGTTTPAGPDPLAEQTGARPMWLLVAVTVVLVGLVLATAAGRRSPAIGRWSPIRVARWLWSHPAQVLGCGVMLFGLALPVMALDDQDWLPLAALTGTFLFTAGAFLGFVTTRAGQPLGAAVMAITAGQAWLAYAALSQAKAHLVAYEVVHGAIDRDEIYNNDPALIQLRQQVENAANDLYPLGLAAFIVLLMPWALGTVLAGRGSWKPIAVLCSLGVVALIVAYVQFSSINGLVLDILE